MEAMSAGLPVVATQVGDLPYLLADGRGLLVPVGQPDRLASAVIGLLNDEQLRRGMGAAARDYIRRHHNPSAWMDHLLAVYSSEAKGELEAAR
jgi:glycosyltransferase involved in cell wall biosynthesis